MAFLSSGTLLRPILAKSQCWCVDGESKFVLRVAHDSYYRIELPNSCPAENQKVEEFKEVLAKVLQYELTPCPFKRGFTVDLPEPPKTPIRKRPWKPQPRPQPLTTLETHKARIGEDDTEDDGTREDDTREAGTIENKMMKDLNSKEQERAGYGSAESKDAIIEEQESGSVDGYTLSTSNISSLGGSMVNSDSEATDDTRITPEIPGIADNDERDSFKTPTRPKPLRTGRAITAPPQLFLKMSPPVNTTLNKPSQVSIRKEPSSQSSSTDSFHSFHSPISPLPPSPPYSDPSSPSPNSGEGDGINLRRTRSHKRDSSELTVTAQFPGLWDLTNAQTTDNTYTSSPVLPETPTLISDVTSQSESTWPEAVTPSPSSELRNRRPAPVERQTTSPLPSPSNLYSPRARFSGHHLKTAIFQKTCSLLLGPPVQLVALMLNIASKIARGAYRGASFGYGESGQKIPCSWDFSDAEDDSDPGWEEDDFGFSLSNVTSSKSLKVKETGGSWEID